MEQIKLDDIMNGNVKSTVSQRLSKPAMAIYKGSSTFRFNRLMGEDLGHPQKIAFFVKGKYVFFIPDPVGDELDTFEIKGQSTDKQLSFTSSPLAKLINKALELKYEKSVKLCYEPYSTNKFGIIFQVHEYDKCKDNENKV